MEKIYHALKHIACTPIMLKMYLDAPSLNSPSLNSPSLNSPSLNSPYTVSVLSEVELESLQNYKNVYDIRLLLDEI